MVRAIPDDCQLVLLDKVPYLIYAEKRSFLDVPEHRARAGKNPFWNDPAPEAPRIVEKKKVDEVAILLKDYGRK